MKPSRATRIALNLLPVLIGALLFFGAIWAEHTFFPVVKDFTILSAKREGKNIVLSGVMRKVRDCAFVGVTAHGVAEPQDAELAIKFLDSNGEIYTRPPGPQFWGPWSITIPTTPNVKEVKLSAVHSCHPAWVTKTDLVNIPVSLIK